MQNSSAHTPKHISTPQEWDALIMERSSRLRIPGGKEKARAWEQVSHSISANKAGTSTLVVLQIAAGLVFLCLSIVAAWQLTGQQTTTDLHQTVQTSKGATEQISLPDGSLVTLGPASTLSWNEQTWDKNRAMDLQGEAFFEVQKGSSFTVHSRQGTVSVYGTSFNVNGRREQLEVRCYTGKVGVSTKNSTTEQFLLPGQGVKVQQEHYQPFTFDTSNQLWREDKYAFEETVLSEVFEEISLQTGYEIKGVYPVDKAFTGTFRSGDVQELIEVVCLPMQLHYTIDQKQKVVTVQPPFNQ